MYADGRWRMWFRATPGEPAKGERHVYFTGVNESRSWAALALERLTALKRPPVPAPFHFTIGRFQITGVSPGAPVAE